MAAKAFKIAGHDRPRQGLNMQVLVQNAKISNLWWLINIIYSDFDISIVFPVEDMSFQTEVPDE